MSLQKKVNDSTENRVKISLLAIKCVLSVRKIYHLTLILLLDVSKLSRNKICVKQEAYCLTLQIFVQETNFQT